MPNKKLFGPEVFESCEKYFYILQYTNFILMNGSRLNKEEKIKIKFHIFAFIFISFFEKLVDKEDPLNK